VECKGSGPQQAAFGGPFCLDTAATEQVYGGWYGERVRVIVNYDLCESNALCMGVAPQVFEVRDDDFLYLLDENPPEDLREKIEEAVRICPKQAISIEG
jgi:ferredoxin